jgi:6-phosphogluconolactonase
LRINGQIGFRSTNVTGEKRCSLSLPFAPRKSWTQGGVSYRGVGQTCVAEPAFVPTDLNITRADTLDEAAAEAAQDFVERAAQAVRDQSRFVVALSGGSTPARLYQLLVSPQWRDEVDWTRTYVFWGDERMAPPTSPDSNFRLAREHLLAHVPIPAANIHPVDTTKGSAQESARAYDEDVHRFFTQPQGQWPRFDLILLGLGSDGHTASLFPGAAALAEERARVTWSPPGVLPPPVDRVTFTLPMLNAAAAVAFLVVGADKAAAVHQVLEEPSDLPAARVHPTAGELRWFLDRAATSQLRS